MHTTASSTQHFIFAIAALSAGLGACAGTGSHAESASHDAAPGGAHATEAVTPKQASQRLVEGNARFVAGHSEHAHQDPQRRTELANTQHPFATILGCADSRTGPELVFDQGLGELFVVREAGNVLDDHTLGSIEYAAEHLHSHLIVVLGHERCGAVGAARDTLGAGGHAEGHIDSLVQAIRPAVEATKGQDAAATCKANVANMVHALKSSTPLLKPLVDKGEVEVVGAYYDLDTGLVTFLAEP